VLPVGVVGVFGGKVDAIEAVSVTRLAGTVTDAVLIVEVTTVVTAFEISVTVVSGVPTASGVLARAVVIAFMALV
jgi:hypothetical protein